jgi:hypothetical protein
MFLKKGRLKRAAFFCEYDTLRPQNMKPLLLLILAFLSKIEPVFAQSGTWERINVGDSTTVDFPGTPKKILYKGQTAYGLYVEDGLYSVSIQAAATEAGLTVEEKRQFYDEAMQGAAKTAKASQVLSKARFSVNGFEGLETTFLSTIAKVKNPVVIRMVLINGTLYGQTFSASASPAHEVVRQRFFASFAPQLRPAAVTPAETRTTAYKIGQLLGSLLGYGGIIGGIVFLLLRSTTKKKKEPIV